MKKISGKKILVTGGSGFIGSHTAKALDESGAKVIIIDKSGAKNSKAAFYNIDIRRGDLKKVFEKEKPEIVYDFAFDASAYRFMDDKTALKKKEGLKKVLLICKKYGVEKFIFASSGAVYGNAGRHPAKESDSLLPNSPYGKVKLLMENLIKKSGVPYVILRYSTVYGAFQKSGAMTYYIKTLVAGKQAEIFGDGTKTSDYVYIDDVVKANLAVLNLPDKFENPVFNVSAGVQTTLNDLYFKIAELLGKSAKPNYLPERPGELVRYSLDYSKIKDALGWEPNYSLDEGLKKRLTEEGYKLAK